jgi:hypothetical protein
VQNANPPWIRLLSALPDAITACGCAIVWIAPLALGPDAVKTVLLMMLMEFILVHATGFFIGTVAGGGSGARRVGTLLGFSLFYLLFVVAFAWSFHAWWPVAAFLWLLVGKIAWTLADPRGREEETQRQMGAWAFSLLAYIGSVFAGLFLPLPALGLDAATVAGLHLPASGEWIEHPHVAVASAVIYYAALAAFKAWGGRVPVQPAGKT